MSNNTLKKVLNNLKHDNDILFDGDEKQFENYILEDIKEICLKMGLSDIKKTEQQKVIQLKEFKIIPDIFIIHKDNTITIFEIKCTNKNNYQTSPIEQCKAIGQLLLYRNVIKAKYKVFPRMFMATDKLFERTVYIFNENNIPVNLMEIQNGRVMIIYNN